MPEKHLADFNLYDWALWLIISLLGGIARFAKDALKDRRRMNWQEFFLKSIVALFAGQITGWACIAAGLGFEATTAAISLASYFAVEAMEAYKLFALRRAGIDEPQQKEERA